MLKIKSKTLEIKAVVASFDRKFVRESVENLLAQGWYIEYIYLTKEGTNLLLKKEITDDDTID